MKLYGTHKLPTVLTPKPKATTERQSTAAALAVRLTLQGRLTNVCPQTRRKTGERY